MSNSNGVKGYRSFWKLVSKDVFLKLKGFAQKLHSIF